uniref:Superoxide dismutase copper/zinc binding domain-containing protein n=1 Tax=Salvator merianae TaxID=96440 RepID=A0A8D0C1X7_SALMN
LATIGSNGPVTVPQSIREQTPGKHRLHIHEFGDNTNGSTSAEDEERHVGDLGTGTVNASGMQKYQYKMGLLLFLTLKKDNLGKDENEESFQTGNAGPCLTCGIIGLIKV